MYWTVFEAGADLQPRVLKGDIHGRVCCVTNQVQDEVPVFSPLTD